MFWGKSFFRLSHNMRTDCLLNLPAVISVDAMIVK